MDIKKHNLSQFAQDFYGFEMKKNSTVKNISLSNGKDTIIIKRHPDENYTFWSPTSNNKGSVIDLVMWQENADMLQACKIAREKITGFMQSIKKGTSQAPKHLESVSELDQEKLRQLKPVESLQYLESRGIDNIKHGRFKETIFTDERHNAVFPHTDAAGKITGYAMKNAKFNGFSPGGTKTLWKSNQFDKDKQLVITESAIDALSYAKLMKKRDPKQMFNSRFTSTEGAFSPEVQEMLKVEIASMPEGTRVVAAFDNDDQGWKYAADLKMMSESLGRKCKTDIPKVKGYDWNQVLIKSLEREKELGVGNNPEKKPEAKQEEAMQCQI